MSVEEEMMNYAMQQIYDIDSGNLEGPTSRFNLDDFRGSRRSDSGIWLSEVSRDKLSIDFVDGTREIKVVSLFPGEINMIFCSFLASGVQNRTNKSPEPSASRTLKKSEGSSSRKRTW